MCTLTFGSRTTTILCGQGLGIRGSRTRDPCPNCESGRVHCIPAENLTYQLLDWEGWVPHPSNYSCTTLKVSSNIPWNRESLLCALAHQVIPSSYHWEPLVRVCLRRDCKHPCEFSSHFNSVTVWFAVLCRINIWSFYSAQFLLRIFLCVNEAGVTAEIVLFLFEICFLQWQLLRCELPGKSKVVTVRLRDHSQPEVNEWVHICIWGVKYCRLIVYACKFI